ncbi:glutaryl-CoA dehydrogenase [Xanthomonas bromi]|uniref:glutaryl-CoA dehydrogenase (ETF) n=1 Tax=Xanthomonas bromi TaxID=56449 RepID=A0A1C3NMT7_9XANT|nr:glutaryl-CoA dehydrogenase [Xanthomonas bromi]
MPVRPDDLFDVRALLTDEERAVQEAVARFTDTRVVPAIGDAFDAGRFPREWIPELAELGLLGASLPVRDGGAGLGAVSYGLICQELERGDSGLRSFVSVQSSLCMYPIHAYGSDQQRQRWLPEMAAGRVIGCFGLSEAQGGSDPAAMTTRAVREGDGWRLSGAKMWITNGSIAGLAIIWAHTDDGVRGFLVETDSAGFSAHEISHKMSLRASVTSGLFLENVFVPEQMRLPEAAGLKAPLSCLNQARYGIAWGAIGAAVACLREALAYAGERILFGRPLAATQSAQIKLADMARRNFHRPATGLAARPLEGGRYAAAGTDLAGKVE